MIQGDLFSASPVAPPRISSQTPLAEGLPSIIDVIAQVSTRPRYAFMVLNLIARAAGQEQLPGDPDAASRLVEQVVLERVRRSGRCNVSRAVSELVRAGLVRRHYEGWRVDHHNRGARREAVYTLLPDTMRALGKA